MFHLADWIVTAVAGPILVLACVGTFTSSIRTRMNARRIDEFEEEMSHLKDLPKRLSVLENTVKLKMIADKDATDRNDSAHARIEKCQGEYRREMLETIRDMKADLLREFRKNNGNNHNSKPVPVR